MANEYGFSSSSIATGVVGLIEHQTWNNFMATFSGLGPIIGLGRVGIVFT